jgi:hypothetical protein
MTHELTHEGHNGQDQNAHTGRWKKDSFYRWNESNKWHETTIISTALRRKSERLHHRQGKVDTIHLRQHCLEGLRNSFQNTLKEQTGKHQQGILQPVAHWEKECDVLWREQIMFCVQHARGIFDTHIDAPVNRSAYEPGIIMGEGEESNDILTSKQLLD